MKKKVMLFVCIVFDLMVVFLIPFNLMLIKISIPEFVTVVLSVLAVILATFYFKTFRKEKNVSAVVFVAAFLTLVISTLGTYCNPYWNSTMFLRNVDYGSKSYDLQISQKEAMEDLEYAMKYLNKLHPALYGGMPKDICEQYESIRDKIKDCNSISVNELAKDIESIFSKLRDGHTYVTGYYNDRKIMKYYREWVKAGDEIVAVNGVSIEELLEENSDYYSFETTSWEYQWLLDDILTEAGVDYLGFDIEQGIEYTLMSKDGTVHKEVCYEEDFLLYDAYAEYNHINDDIQQEESFVQYEIDSEKNLAVLQLDECNYNEKYVNCLRDMFTEIKEKKIENVVVDLRYNGGGNDLVVKEFIRYLDVEKYKVATMDWRLGFLYLKGLGNGIEKNNKYEELLFSGNMYLLTSANTFSSAMKFAEYVKDNNLGIIIGEAPGNNPNGYGEVAGFKLPNSRLFMQISTKRFYRANAECRDLLVYPDIECKSDDKAEMIQKIINE